MLGSIQERVPLSISNLKLTRKQYYSRLHNLIICGLIQKTNGRYRLTSFGKVIFDWHVVIRDTIAKEYWKLRAIDMLGSSGIPDSERSKMMDTLIENEKLRQFLSRQLTKKKNSPQNKQDCKLHTSLESKTAKKFNSNCGDRNTVRQVNKKIPLFSIYCN